MKKTVAFILILACVFSLFAQGGKESSETKEGTEPVDFEIWTSNAGYLETAKNSVGYNFYKEMTGYGLWQPYVEWNGGKTYKEQLNLRIAANDLPDIFYPADLGESLAANGALLDLTDILPKTKLWDAVPERVWKMLAANDPTGEGRIWGTPSVISYARYGALVRRDWLDKLGLDMPTTQEEFVNVLRAFKTQDPNGNGLADEIPTGGRQEARWMDYLFNMYGVVLFEGQPAWDIYDGELTYSAVTKNMRDALEFIAYLYKEGLLDSETLLNSKAKWDGKIDSGIVGVYYHIPQSSYKHAISVYSNTGVKADWEVLPKISAPGYEACYPIFLSSNYELCFKNTDDPARIEAITKFLDAYGDKSKWDDFYYGAPGMHCTVDENGQKHMNPIDYKNQSNLILNPGQAIATVESMTTTLEATKTPDNAWAYDRAIKNLKYQGTVGKEIAGNGIPTSIYEGYPDIQNRTLYIQYASKIIIGEWPIEKFDEFVAKWYATGGEEVTRRAREWYANVNK